jgi:hypothetical protein
MISAELFTIPIKQASRRLVKRAVDESYGEEKTTCYKFELQTARTQRSLTQIAFGFVSNPESRCITNNFHSFTESFELLQQHDRKPESICVKIYCYLKLMIMKNLRNLSSASS